MSTQFQNDQIGQHFQGNSPVGDSINAPPGAFRGNGGMPQVSQEYPGYSSNNKWGIPLASDPNRQQIIPQNLNASIQDEPQISQKDIADLVTAVRNWKNMPTQQQQTVQPPMTPTTPTEYEYKAPEGANINPEMDKAFRELAHKNGLTQEQFKNINDFVFQKGVKVSEDVQAQQAKELAERENQCELVLRKEWGAQFDLKMGKIKHMLFEHMGESGVNFLSKSELRTDPGLMRMFGVMAERMTEHTFRNTQNESGNLLNFSDQLGSYMKNPAYFDESHPDHARIVNQAMDLYKLKYQA